MIIRSRGSPEVTTRSQVNERESPNFKASAACDRADNLSISVERQCFTTHSSLDRNPAQSSNYSTESRSVNNNESSDQGVPAATKVKKQNNFLSKFKGAAENWLEAHATIRFEKV